MANYSDYPVESLHLYAGIDTYVTSKLLGKLRPEIFENPVLKDGKKIKSVAQVYEDLIAPAFEFILDLELNGLQYDVQRNLELRKRIDLECQALSEEFGPQVGTTNVNSSEQLRSLLYGVMEMTPPSFTKEGDPSTDGDAIKALAEIYGHPWMLSLAKYKDLSSVNNTFLKTYVEDFVKPDGRIHPTYNLHGTSGFRISGEDPNLTQLPKAKHGYNIRECYTVPEGFDFITLDYSSAEVKVLANICKDEKLLKALGDGLDPHMFSASRIFKIPYEDIASVLSDPSHPLYKDYKGKRQLAKAVTFGILYGSTAKGIASKNGITDAEAEQIISMYLDEFPNIKAYIFSAHKTAVDNHYVVTPFGRRKRQWGTMPYFRRTAAYNGALRNAQNSLIQSTASDIGLMAFGEVNRRIKSLGARCTCTVYDSIEIESPKEVSHQVLDIAFRTMDDWVLEVLPWMVLPIGVEAEIGSNWGNCEIIHRKDLVLV